ncbi:putative malate dehydrogenase protein [Zalerion maritima]|uniref:Malate dehydrogenase protein n=1 Tax=Zalerion maritima TaxID=339359 RepID=A0AAD5WTJ4_9PEZI|nr:putative malate dehydrogenase protein [Zalerion maritima]
MHFSTIISTFLTLGVSSVLAAPTTPSFIDTTSSTGNYQDVSDYFNLLAKKALNSHFMSVAPVCDVNSAVMSESPVPLEPPTAGLTLHHVAIGRGVQNYTCANSSSAPEAAGAVATLFNATCLASTHPEIANILPSVALKFDLSDGDRNSAFPRISLFPSNLAVSGKHFFNSDGVPFFNLDTPAASYGKASCAKDAAESAPDTAAKGQKGENAVAWLRLNTTDDGTTGSIKQVYRLQTAGGSPPASCEGMDSEFSVQYAAQ